MNEFLHATLSDIRGGRETWRVIIALSAPAFVLALVISAIH